MSQEREGLDALLASLGLMLQKIDEDKIRTHTNEFELNFRITYVKSRLGELLIQYAFE